MKIATWNINGVRARIDNLLTWLKESGPDIVCLQEIKCQDEAFPRGEGSKRWAIMSRPTAKRLQRGCVLSQVPPRRCSARVAGRRGRRAVSAISRRSFGRGRGACALPASICPTATVIRPGQISLQAQLDAAAGGACAERLALEEPFILAGDYNVIPETHDCWDPKVWKATPSSCRRDAAGVPAARKSRLDGRVRATSDGAPLYNVLGLSGRHWQKNWGIRIDHLLLSPEAADRLQSTSIEKYVRDWEKPSDHVPVGALLFLIRSAEHVIAVEDQRMPWMPSARSSRNRPACVRPGSCRRAHASASPSICPASGS